MSKNIFKSQIRKKIETVATEIQSLVNEEFQRDLNQHIKNSALQQAGLKNGKEIIDEYSVNFEYGLAFEHLLYMIDETGITVSQSSSTLLFELSEEMNLSIDEIKSQLKLK